MSLIPSPLCGTRRVCPGDIQNARDRHEPLKPSRTVLRAVYWTVWPGVDLLVLRGVTVTALRMAEKDGELGNGARAPTETACQAAAFSVVRSAGMHHRHAAIDRLPELVES